MSERRERQMPRMIVRRPAAPTVGERRPRQIVRRSGRGVQAAPASRRRLPSVAWRPSRRGILAVAGVAVFALVIAAGAWLWRSPLLEVSHVDVDGTERITKEAIVERAGLLGQSMFTADLATAQQKIYEHPLVASVKIERVWPNTIHIEVEERQAWGVWEQGGVRYTIDRDGVVLGTTPPAPGSPVIRGSDTTTLRQGDRVDYQAVQATAEIYELLPRQLGTTVTEVAFLPGKGVQVSTADGQSALFGDSSSIGYKLAVWAAMAQQARAQGINYTTIDLRFGNRPVLQ
ncbi:MAG: cell division protein FtsQ/DivIB [Hyphomicrobiales bacterium]